MPDSQTPCDRCELLPGDIGSEIDLYISAPVEATRTTLTDTFQQLGLTASYFDDVLRVQVDAARFPELTASLHEQLSEQELDDTRVLVKDRESEPRLSDFVSMQTLDSLVARIEGQNLLDILRNGGLRTHVQPLIDPKQPDTPFAYECLTRGVDGDGNVLSPGYLFGTARKAELIFYLDRESRMTAVRSAAPLAANAKLFVNFNPTTIYKPESCLASTMQVMQEVGLTRDDVVFEVVESDSIAHVDHLRRILDYYREQGFEVALDDLGAGYNSLTSLSDLRPDYMKLDMDLCRDVNVDPYRETIAKNLIGLARDLGIATIAEGIETAEEAQWFTNAGVDYIQGYYFARPLPVSEVIAANTR
jgi:EAL domain-containing protein (putative c-di-GMP-specific phosphodiesterase class I)